MIEWSYARIAAHRGGGRLAPENTLAGIDAGARFGHRMIEFDVKLSRDGQPFLLHDDTLDRTSNAWGVAGCLDWLQLKRVDAGSWFGRDFDGEPLPLLSEVAERCRRYGMEANIEIKPTTGLDVETGAAVARAAQTLWQGMKAPLLSSFSPQALAAARCAVPELPRGLLMDRWREDWRQQARSLECVSLHLNHRLLTPDRITAIKREGLRILAYTVNSPHRARELLRLGVDTVCTDRIDIIGPDFGS